MQVCFYSLQPQSEQSNQSSSLPWPECLAKSILACLSNGDTSWNFGGNQFHCRQTCLKTLLALTLYPHISVQLHDDFCIFFVSFCIVHIWMWYWTHLKNSKIICVHFLVIFLSLTHKLVTCKNQTYIIVPGLLNVLDRCDLLSFLLGGLGLFGSLVLGLSLELFLWWFWLFLDLSGCYWCRGWCCSLGLSWLFGSCGCKRAANDTSRLWLLALCLGLAWLGPLLGGRFVEGTLLTDWCLVSRRARGLVLGRRMRNRKWRLIKTFSRHQPLRLAVET